MLLQNHLFTDTVKGWFFMLAKDTLEEFKLECELRRLTPRTIKGTITVHYCSSPGCSFFDGVVGSQFAAEGTGEDGFFQQVDLLQHGFGSFLGPLFFA